MNITFISSFVPRKCGIATYTKDLALELSDQKQKIGIIAMENLTSPTSYGHPVIHVIKEDSQKDYEKAARIINASSTDIVHIQHEFGLFGGKDGSYILEFAQALSKPFVTTLHTVLITPTARQKYIIQELARLSRKVIVMEEIAKDRLKRIYGLDPRDITVIFHGSPTITIRPEKARKELGLSKNFVLLANNLLSSNKGFEYAIEAVAQVIPHIPSILFLIIGETHPVVKANEGEKYRNKLIALVKKLHLENHVIFINKYITLEQLKTYIAASDIYITPYLDPQQITSGTLSYALGANKVCIATEYIYAKNMLAHGQGILVPFKNSQAIAKALLDIFQHPDKRKKIEKRASILKKQMSWSHVAHKHTQLYQEILIGYTKSISVTKKFLQQPLDIHYLQQLTDTTGMMQHAYHMIPDKRFGYSTDDNARGLIVASLLYQKDTSQEILKLVNTYLGFLQFAQEKNGTFHTFLTFDHTWADRANVNDAYGKCMWALGYYLSLHKNSYLSGPTRLLFELGMQEVGSIRDLRTAAYTMLGLYYYLEAFIGKTDQADIAKEQLISLADFLVLSYEKAKDEKWKWFEDTATYDNFRLPQALFAAYLLTKKQKYRLVAEITLAFITHANFNKEEGYFDFIGQDGWYGKNKEKAIYDQQPLEAGGAVEAFLFAKKALKKKQYQEKALIAFSWFFGHNRNHRALFDFETKGVHDGLNPRGVNLNEGAESIVCFLMAAFALQNI